jgi:hypothetical protein
MFIYPEQAENCRDRLNGSFGICKEKHSETKMFLSGENRNGRFLFCLAEEPVSAKYCKQQNNKHQPTYPAQVGMRHYKR